MIIIVSLQCVFHSIRFKVNKGLGPSGDPFFLPINDIIWNLVLLFLRRRLAKNVLVILHQLAYHKEYVDSRNTIGYQTRDIVALGIAFALDESLIPKSGELCTVLLYLVDQLFLAKTDLLKRSEFMNGFFLNW